MTTGVRFTRNDDLMAAIMVTEESENPLLVSARDNLILAAKMAHGDEFETAKTNFHERSVVFVRTETLMDRFLGFVDAVSVKDGKSPWARMFGK